MKNILRNFVFIVWTVALLPVNVSAQNRRDKEQTYVLEQPYEVTKITPSQGKKIKNVNRVNQNFRAVGLKYAALEPPL